MLIRVVLLFLVAMLVLGMVQKMLRPKSRGGAPRAGPSALDRLRCPSCGQIATPDTPVPCARPDCGSR